MFARKCRTQLLGDLIVVEPLDGGHARAGARNSVGDTRTHRNAIDQDGARTTDAVLATEMGAGEILRFPDEIGEVRARFDVRVHIPAVDLEGQHFHDPSACPIARRRTARCTCWSIGSLKPRAPMVLRTNSRLRTAAAPSAFVNSPSAFVRT